MPLRELLIKDCCDIVSRRVKKSRLIGSGLFLSGHFGHADAAVPTGLYSISYLYLIFLFKHLGDLEIAASRRRGRSILVSELAKFSREWVALLFSDRHPIFGNVHTSFPSRQLLAIQ